MNHRIKLAIVIPVYGNRESLPILYERIIRSTENENADLTILFVNDRSPDESQDVLEQLAEKDSRVKVVLLSKNHGSFVAVVAGLFQVRDHDAVVVISADLQDPPELIPQMIEKWRQGKPVVLCVRKRRADSFTTKMFSRFFYIIFRKLAIPEMPIGGFDFCLIDKRIVDVLIRSSEKNTSLMGLIIWAGFDRAYIEYDRAERPFGHSMWSFHKKMRYAINSIISFSAFPLKILGFLGIGIGVLCLVGAGFLVYHYFSSKILVPGWTSIIFLILGLSALQFIGFGILGEYFWHSLEQNRQRPLFIIDKKIGFVEDVDSSDSSRGNFVPFFDNVSVSEPINNSLLESCSRVLRSKRLILGREVETFERELAAYLGVKFIVGVANATDAITMALWAMGIKEGDKVITSAISAPATAVAILRAGAQPIYVDVEPKGLTISLAGIEKALKLGVKAIVPVHLYGNPCDIKGIMELAKKHDIVVVEDCAQSLGTTVDGAYCGTFGSISAFSFYPTKNLGGYGDGGALATNDFNIVEKLRRMRFYGQNESGECVERGLNSRLDELQAALLSDRLKILEEQNNRRKFIAEQYDKKLGFLNPVVSHSGRVPHLYVVRPSDRVAFRKFLADREIETGIHYSMPLSKHAHLCKYGIDTGITVAHDVCQRVVSLPCFPGLKNSQVERVIEVCRLWKESQK